MPDINWDNLPDKEESKIDLSGLPEKESPDIDLSGLPDKTQESKEDDSLFEQSRQKILEGVDWYQGKRTEQEKLRLTRNTTDVLVNAGLDLVSIPFVAPDIVSHITKSSLEEKTMTDRFLKAGEQVGLTALELVTFAPKMLYETFVAAELHPFASEKQVKKAQESFARNPLFHTLGASATLSTFRSVNAKPKVESKPYKELKMEEKVAKTPEKVVEVKAKPKIDETINQIAKEKSAIDFVAKNPDKVESLLSEINKKWEDIGKPKTESQLQQKIKLSQVKDLIKQATGKSKAPKEVAKKVEQIRQAERQQTKVVEGEKLYVVDPTVVEIEGFANRVAKAIKREPTSEANAVMREIAQERTGDIAFGEIKADQFRTQIDNSVKRITANQPKLQKIKDIIKDREWGKEIKEDLIYYLDKTGNPFVPKDTFQSLSNRLPKEAKNIANNVRAHFNDLWEVINKSEYISDVDYISNYITHLYSGSKKKQNAVIGNLERKFKFAKQRKWESYHEAAIEGGLKPRFTDVGQIIQFYENAAYRVMANNKMVAKLKALRSPEGKGILYSEKQLPQELVGEYIRIEDPIFTRKWVDKDGKPVSTRHAYVHPEIAKPLQNLLDKGWSFDNPILQTVKFLNAISKKTMLTLSFFHHLALTESSAATGAWNFPKSALRGRELLKRMDETMEIGVRNGLQVKSTSDIHRSTIEKLLDNFDNATKNVPIVNQGARTIKWLNTKWDKMLWDYYHTNLKADAFNRIYTENLNRLGKKFSEKEIARETANFVNDAFGGQNWDGYLNVKHFKKGEQVAQLLFLAPDWTLSNLKIAARAIGSPLRIGKPTNRQALAYWARAGAMFTVGQQMAQYGFWEAADPEIKKTHSPWMWDNAPEDKLSINTFTKDDKGRFIYVKPLKQAREVLRYFTDFTEITGNKFSPIVREVIEQYTGHSPGSGFKQPYADMEFYESLPVRIKNILLKPIPLSLKDSNFMFILPKKTGMNYYKTNKLFTESLRHYAEGDATSEKGLEFLKEIKDHAIDNNLDAKDIFTVALSSLRSRYYYDLFTALNKGDLKETEKYATYLARLNASTKDVRKSLQNKYERFMRENQLDINKAEERKRIRESMRMVRKSRDTMVKKFKRELNKE